MSFTQNKFNFVGCVAKSVWIKPSNANIKAINNIFPFLCKITTEISRLM